MSTSTSSRQYERIAAQLIAAGSLHERMQQVVDLLWPALSPHNVSWLGFYIDQPGEPDDRRLILGPCRNKPACSPIGLHGVCGQALLSRQTRIIDDVAALGPDYIACDPLDRSEIVVPIFDANGNAYAVLDLDSHQTHAFSQHDEQGLHTVLRAAGLV